MQKRDDKKKVLIIIIILLILMGIFSILRFSLNGGEDTWIKDSRGVWIKHGNPSEIPDYVKEQQEIIQGAKELYETASMEIQFNSQCLGEIKNYAVDIVHVPRNFQDDVESNQCIDYLTGKLNNFIELDKDGNIVGIV
jgi:hypothetical protein